MRPRHARPRVPHLARRLAAWPLAAAFCVGLAAAPARAEVVSAKGYALAVHGPFALTAADLDALAASAAVQLPGAASDVQAREAKRERGEEESEQDEGLGFRVDANTPALPPPGLEPEGSPLELFAKAQTPAAVTSWKGLPSVGDWAADTQIAASHTHVVVTTRTTIGFYSKAGGLLQQISASDFFAPAKLAELGSAGGVKNYFDNRLIFDPYRNRF